MTTPQATKRDAQREATRAAVLDAAVAAFTMKGYDGTSLSSVSDASGIPIPLIVYHFGSKLGLWQAVVASIYERLDEHLNAAETAIRAGACQDSLKQVLHSFTDAFVRCPEYTRLLFKEGTEPSSRLEWLVERYQKPVSLRVCGVIEHAQTAGLLPRGGDPMMLKYLVSGMVSLPFALAPELAAMTGEDAADEAFVDRYVDLCLTVLAGGKQGSPTD